MRPITSHLLFKIKLILALLLGGMVCNVHSAKLINVGVLDRDYLIVNISDGDVIHQDEANKVEQILRYTPELDTGAALQSVNWTITSATDTNYGASGQIPLSCSRKKKLSGHAEMEWSGNDYRYEYTYEHWIYLQLPSSLQQGATYQLAIGSAVNSDTPTATFTFDQFNSRSEAIHVNLVGYTPDAPHKGADLYYWMGSGGPRNYSSFEGNSVYLYNVSTSVSTPIGVVEYWKQSGRDVGGYNLTASDVWNVDFSNAFSSGTYRLVVEGVGSSQDFKIADDIYQDPFIVSLRGYFYMRIGESNPNNISPPPRTPLYIPGQSPANTTVYLTTMHPYHPDWETFASGDKWDQPNSWSSYEKSATLNTNPNAWQYEHGINACILSQPMISKKSNAGKSSRIPPAKPYSSVSLAPLNPRKRAATSTEQDDTSTDKGDHHHEHNTDYHYYKFRWVWVIDYMHSQSFAW